MVAGRRKPEVKLAPEFQAQLLRQMRQEQAAALRARRIKLFVVVPAFVAFSVWSILLASSPDRRTSTIGGVLTSCLITLLWMLRKRLGAVLGRHQ